MPRLEAPDETDWAAVANNLSGVTRHSNVEARSSLRDHLLVLAGDYAAKAARVDLTIIRRDSHTLLDASRRRHQRGWQTLERLDQFARDAIHTEITGHDGNRSMRLERNDTADALAKAVPDRITSSTAGGNRVPSKLRRHLRSRSSRDGDAPHKLCWRSRSCPSSPFPPAEPTPEPTYALGYAAIDVSVVAGPLPEASRHSGKREKAAALLADLDALRDLPAVPLEACEHVPGQVSSTALVRYRLVDYSAPAIHAHKRVMVKGYVDRVEIALGAETVARHRRSYVRE